MEWLLKPIKRWHCRRQFNRLTPQWQRIFRMGQIDPDSLIARGEL